MFGVRKMTARVRLVGRYRTACKNYGAALALRLRAKASGDDRLMGQAYADLKRWNRTMMTLEGELRAAGVEPCGLELAR